MKLLAGLGNPGRRYEGTAHNLGFDVIDVLARRWSLSFRAHKKADALVAEGTVAGIATMLIKPQTFMNRSGQALAVLTQQRPELAESLLVIADDINLPIGRLRLRPAGGHGGHNGLRSIIESVGSQDFPRLRVGIQPPWPVDDLTDYVLRKLPPLERGQLNEMAELAADAAETWLREGVGPASDRFNGLVRFAAASAADG